MNRKRLGSLALLLGIGIATCCTTLRDAPSYQAMSEEDAAAFRVRAAATAKALAQAALVEQDVTPQAVKQAAEALRSLATGPVVVAHSGTLADLLELDGYGALALTLALSSVDEQLASDGWAITPRMAALLIEVADALEAAARGGV